MTLQHVPGNCVAERHTLHARKRGELPTQLVEEPHLRSRVRVRSREADARREDVLRS